MLSGQRAAVLLTETSWTGEQARDPPELAAAGQGGALLTKIRTHSYSIVGLTRLALSPEYGVAMSTVEAPCSSDTLDSFSFGQRPTALICPH